MNESVNDRLYKLLPAVYRIRDAKQKEPLRALLRIIEEQAKTLEEDIDGLYNDWFIETCADWVIPYIGDLVGNKPIHEIKKLRRTDVAKTIDYRRRKGTAAMLEEMARDVTGWSAHVVEFFKLLGWTQNVNHLRFEMSANPEPGSPNAVDRVGTVNLRSMDALDRLDGPFDIISHTIDIRPVCTPEGWHNLRNIGFFLWRLQHYPMAVVTPRPVHGYPYCYTFSRLGNMAPLFHKPHREDDETRLAAEINVPGPIRPMAFDIDLQEFRKNPPGTTTNSGYYGPERGLCIVKDGTPMPPDDIVCMDLRHYDRPSGGKAAIDVKRGLVSFAPGEEPASPHDLTKFSVNYTYGFSADIGGGPYERIQYVTDRLTLCPNYGKAGTNIVITGRYFVSEVDIDIKFEGEKEIIKTIKTDKEGSFWTTITVPNKQPGNYDVKVKYSSKKDYEETTKFTVIGSDSEIMNKPKQGIVVINVSKSSAINTIHKALKKWESINKWPCLIRILDNGIYGGNIDIELPEDGWLMIQAANGVWPNIRLVGITSLAVLKGNATLIMDGLLIEGAFEMSGGLNLTLQHCTMVPGRMLTSGGEPAFPDRDSLVVKTVSDELCVTIKRSIIGSIRIPGSAKCLAISDSIIQSPSIKGKPRFAIAADDMGDKPGPPAVIDRSTIFGPVRVKKLARASEAIFTAPVKTERQQEGCVRFSYVPEDSLVPRRYHCQPDLALDREAENLQRELSQAEKDAVRARMRPHFTSRRYGDSGYAQLSRACAEEIMTGAEDGSEMGVFVSLKQPLREANLRIRLAEYLPFGLEDGFIFVT